MSWIKTAWITSSVFLVFVVTTFVVDVMFEPADKIFLVTLGVNALLYSALALFGWFQIVIAKRIRSQWFTLNTILISLLSLLFWVGAFVPEFAVFAILIAWSSSTVFWYFTLPPIYTLKHLWE